MTLTRADDAQRAVFLDRDGVLTRASVVDGRPRSARSLAELEILPDAVDACRRLRGAGLALVVVTNQPDVACGALDPETLEKIHAELSRRIELDDIIVCPHDDAERCPCRKPAPGMLRTGARRHGIALGHSVMVGDRWRDIEAGQRAGCRTVFVDRGYAETRPSGPDLTVDRLAAAVPWILNELDNGSEQ